MADRNIRLTLRDSVSAVLDPVPGFMPRKGRETANLRDRIYTWIFDAISQGEFPEGSKLPTESELAERLGVSRPTVREALSRLRSDGIIASRRGSGSYVVRRPDANLIRFAPIESIADIQRCFVFRMWVEAGAAGLAAEMRDQRDLDAIEAAYEAMAQALEVEALGVEEDLSFHNAIAEASRNPFFISAIRSIGEPIRQCMHLSRSLSMVKSRARRDQVQAEHKAILDAITKKAPDQASEAMRRHISNARHRMFEGA